MNKKGFTLIELLGVIVLIGLLAIIIVPAVTKTVHKGSKAADQQLIENIKLAAENWAMDHKELLPTTVSLKDLEDGGYIDKDIKMPSTKEKLDEDKICVEITSPKPNVYNYKYSDTCN